MNSTVGTYTTLSNSMKNCSQESCQSIGTPLVGLGLVTNVTQLNQLETDWTMTFRDD